MNLAIVLCDDAYFFPKIFNLALKKSIRNIIWHISKTEKNNTPLIFIKGSSADNMGEHYFHRVRIILLH